MWLGGLFSPEAFITATRQIIAQHLACSLEDLTLRFSVREGSEGTASDATSFTITGLALEGATWERGCLQLVNTIRSSLPSALLSWVRISYITRVSGVIDTEVGRRASETLMGCSMWVSGQGRCRRKTV